MRLLSFASKRRSGSTNRQSQEQTCCGARWWVGCRRWFWGMGAITAKPWATSRGEGERPVLADEVDGGCGTRREVTVCDWVAGAVTGVSDCFAGSVVAIETVDKGAEFGDGPRLTMVSVLLVCQEAGPRRLCVIRAVKREESTAMTRIQDEDFVKAQDGDYGSIQRVKQVVKRMPHLAAPSPGGKMAAESAWCRGWARVRTMEISCSPGFSARCR